MSKAIDQIRQEGYEQGYREGMILAAVELGVMTAEEAAESLDMSVEQVHELLVAFGQPNSTKK